jgi:hypothetical protein
MSTINILSRNTKRAPLVTGGQLSYRTVLLPVARVARAYAMYAANPRFTDVSMIVSPTSPGNGYVTFRPSNPECAERMIEQFSDDRARRAQTTLDNALTYEWDSNPDGSEICYSPKLNKATGEITYDAYTVSKNSCDCADYQYRCRRLNVQCKHQIAQSLRRQEGL